MRLEMLSKYNILSAWANGWQEIQHGQITLMILYFVMPMIANLYSPKLR